MNLLKKNFSSIISEELYKYSIKLENSDLNNLRNEFDSQKQQILKNSELLIKKVFSSPP